MIGTTPGPLPGAMVPPTIPLPVIAPWRSSSVPPPVARLFRINQFAVIGFNQSISTQVKCIVQRPYGMTGNFYRRISLKHNRDLEWMTPFCHSGAAEGAARGIRLGGPAGQDMACLRGHEKVLGPGARDGLDKWQRRQWLGISKTKFQANRFLAACKALYRANN